MEVIESYTFPDGQTSQVLIDMKGQWILCTSLESGLERFEVTDEKGAALIIALAKDAKRRDALEWPDVIE